MAKTNQRNRGVGRCRHGLHKMPVFETLEKRALMTAVVVNSVLDQVDSASSGVVTLRDAIAAANASTTPTSITFSPAVFASRQTIRLDGSRLVIQTLATADTVTITAPAAGVTIDGNHSSGDFVIWTSTTATLNGLTITNGKSTNGAGVDNYGNVTVENCSITGNSSPNGGGVYTNGSAYLLNDTVSGNSGVTGGGIWNSDGGYLSLTDDTVSGNNGTYGGAIYNGGAGNGTLELHNITIAKNTASTAGGGVYNYVGGTVGLSNTIIAGDTVGSAANTSGSDVSGVFASRGYNLIGDVDGGSGFVSTDLLGHSASLLNARLNPLGNYGGPTETMTLQSSSPALAAGSPALINWITTDQRGLPRTVGGLVDIGSVETQPASTTLPVPVVVSPGSSTSTGPILSTLKPTFTWKAVTPFTGFTGYQLNLYDSTAGVFTSFTLGTNVTSFTPTTALVAGHDYVWNLRVLDGSTSGAPSTYLYFQTPPAATLPVPSIVSPGSTTSPGPVLTTLTPAFTWKAVTSFTGFTGYEVSLYDKSTAKTTTWTVGTSITSYTPGTALAAGESYIWNVRVLAGSASGSPSTYLYFQTPAAVTLPAPVVTSPGSTESPGPVLTTLTPTFTWKAVTPFSGFTGYQLNLYDNTAGKFVSYTFGTNVTSFTPTAPLTAGDSYVWNLRVLQGTVSGPPSVYLYFQTPAATTLPVPTVTSPGSSTSPGPVQSGLTLTFAWKAVTPFTGFSGYQLNLYDKTAGTSYQYVLGTAATSYSVPVGDYKLGDQFVWNLRVLQGSTSGAPSTYLYFQLPTALPVPTVVSPGNTNSVSVLTTDTPTFKWDGISGASGYQIDVLDITTSQLYSYTAAGSATSFTTPSALPSGDSFGWTIRVLSGSLNGPASDTYYFKTK